ncbi:hypothetical protein PhCBS80983_g05727 [Powellomyces hirtus]|uniref:Major facilitator superfamily (MFS) profile domain-containing protein n=1 Tax=Powellomyces hirtus TaxID=109895 RepID=A0A507DUC9_9FUNG|nr:hypothetical protein PhCBS80983_g05727 [Powellomyces hirtus]
MSRQGDSFTDTPADTTPAQVTVDLPTPLRSPTPPSSPLPSKLSDHEEADIESLEIKSTGSAHTLKHDDGSNKGLDEQQNILPPRQIVIVFLALSICLMLSLLDQTIVATALPVISTALPGSLDPSWIGTSYMLTSTCFQPLYGRFSDIFGRKCMLLIALFFFLGGSLGCGLSETRLQLVILRAFQGIGGGGILNCAMIIISDVVSLRDRGKYQGILGIVIAAGNALGPPLGGVFSEKVSWRWGFLINIPLGCVATLAVIFLLPLKKVTGNIMGKLAKIDYLGAFLVLAASLLLLLPLVWGGTTYPWISPAILVSAAIGIIAAIGFGVVEWKFAAWPLIPMYLWKNPTVAAVYAVTTLSGIVFYIQLYYIPLYLQIVRGQSVLKSGVTVLPLAVSTTVFSFLSGMIVSKTGKYRWNINIGFSIWTIGAGLMTTMSRTTSVGVIIAFLFITGLGCGQTFQTTLVAAQAAVPKPDMAVVTAVRNFLRTFGGTMAIAIAAAIINNTFTSQIEGEFDSALLSDPARLVSQPPTGLTRDMVEDYFTAGLRHVFTFCAVCIGACLVISVLFIKQHDLGERTVGHKKHEEMAVGNKKP